MLVFLTVLPLALAGAPVETPAEAPADLSDEAAETMIQTLEDRRTALDAIDVNALKGLIMENEAETVAPEAADPVEAPTDTPEETATAATK